MTGQLSLSAQAAIDYGRERASTEQRGRSFTATPASPLLLDSAPAFTPAYTTGLKVFDGEELLTTVFPPRSLMLAPWLPDKGLTMIFAPRGVGKTWAALGIAHAVAGGGAFLRWRATRPRRVLYIDGEMPAVMLQDRYAAIVGASTTDAPAENFRLVAADFQPDGLPDLADSDAQRFYDFVISDAELIIIDNLSTVARGLRENEADSSGRFNLGCSRSARRDDPFSSFTMPVRVAVNAGPLARRTRSTPSSRWRARQAMRRARAHGSRCGSQNRGGSGATTRNPSKPALPMVRGPRAKLSGRIPTPRWWP